MSAVNAIKGALSKGLTPTQAIATSLILKDAVGCYLYVSQARSNKKMTPQQRADVANYDLANGVINIGLQLLAVRPIENLMTKFVEKKWMNHFFTNLSEKLASPDDKVVMKYLKKTETIKKGAVAALSVLVCQYFIKRVVSPFFSVPAGDMTKKLGIIKPKLYAGETFTGKSDLAMNDNNDSKPRFDVMSTPDDDTNLINRYRKYNMGNQNGQLINNEPDYEIYLTGKKS